jgi:lipopolysaccharide export system protein LptA
MFGPSDVQGPGMTVTAKELRGFVDDSEIDLEGNVIAQKKLNSGHLFQLHSGKAQFNGRFYLAHFRDQVVIEYDQMKLESPEASFQYKSQENLLDSVELKGGVKLNDLDKYATAEQIKIEPETNRIVLTGSPRVVQDQDELLGEQIVFIDGGKKVKIEKMRARVEKAPGDK